MGDGAVDILLSARRLNLRLNALPIADRPRDLATAYAVQDRLVAALGDTPVGWKVGCTSRAAQEILGIDRPFAGRLLAATTLESPARVPGAGLRLRGIEAEFGLMLGRDLTPDQAPFTRDSVADAVAAVVPCIEVVEPRYADWRRVDAPGVVADNAAHGLVVTGPVHAGWPVRDLDRHPVRLTVDGREALHGHGADALGHPLAVLAWLADHATGRGRVLAAGDLVITGMCAGHFRPPATHAVADFGDLGRVEVTFD
ncbi:MAG: fumarylacetoacetate hydrolase family protein [Rhodobacterales bacterium]|nr:fumarylacetoacetate hydrolase family protein [Rhodobacterales bacterium]